MKPSTCVTSIDYGEEITSALDFDKFGSMFAVGGSNGSVSVYDLRKVSASGQILTLRPHHASVRCLQFDGNRLISGGYDHQIVSWDIQRNQKRFKIDSSKVLCMMFDDRSLVVGTNNKKVKWYNFAQPPHTGFSSQREVYVQRCG